MKRILVILLLTCITLIPSITSPLASGGEHTTMNGLPRDIYYVRVHTGLTWRYIGSWNKKVINQIYALNGGNTWVGYSSGGFSIPDSGNYESYIELYSRARKEPYYLFIFYSPATPTVRYLFLFNSLKSNCDDKGNYCGNHDFVYYDKLATTFFTDTPSIVAIYRSVGSRTLGR